MPSLAVEQAIIPKRRDACRQIPLSSPDISEDDRQSVLAVLSGTALSLGPALPAFEAAVAHAAGTRFAVAVNSGTSALHLGVKAAGIGDGDEVITTPFSFVASANCVLYERAIPRFVDIEPDTYNMDAFQIAASINEKTRAILPVHVFGRPCNMLRIASIAEENGLAVIEDACEAIGATYKGRKIGSFGESSAFAFYPNKQITTGEGGALATNNETVARLCRSLRNQGRGENGAWLQHERLGYNYRLSDINCTLGLGQLSRLDTILEKRRQVAESYREALEPLPAVIPPHPEEGMSWFVYVVRLQDEFTREQRDQILSSLRRGGIGCNNYFSPIHLQPYFQEMFGFRRGDFPVTEHVADRTIALPFFNNLSQEEIEIVVSSLSRAVGDLKRR
jgi:perosamine synthetase